MLPRIRRDVASIVFLALMTVFGSSTVLAKIVRFSEPGALYMNPSGMNDEGSVVGDYTDATGNRGFLRTPDGTVVSIDEPHTQCGTSVVGITQEGEIVGYGGDSNCLLYGFVRAPDGTFSTFTVPGAILTQVSATNSKGVIVGEYSVDGQSSAAYVRALDGTFQSFTVRGATETWPMGINKKGMVAGEFVDKNNVFHGFIRDARGKITKFDAPDAGATIPSAINDAGIICGSFLKEGVNYSFRRHLDGTFETISLPGNTAAFAINNDGTATGYSTNNGLPLGFIWKSDGTVKTFEPKNSWGVRPYAIDRKGNISGAIENKDQTYPAFLRTQ